MPSWDRPGTVTAGGTAYTIFLADRPDAYSESYRLVWPSAQDIPGAEGKVAGDPFVREWHVNEWSGGEGNDLWKRAEPTVYHRSTNVAPKQTGDGLVLGASQTVTDHDGAATFTEGRRFGLAQGLLWTVRDGTAHWWQPSTEDWDETGWTTGGGTNVATSLIDQGNGTHILIGYDATTDEVRRVASGANAAVTGLTINFPPVLRNWGGTLFHLDGDDLYSFTLSGATATATLQADVTGRSNDYLTNGYEVANRISSSDKGPIWFQRLDNGQTLIHEYNVAADTAAVIGKLPVDFATPYSIFFEHGFYFVGFRYSDSHTASGEAYIHYFRGAQRGVAGPIREVSGTSASRAVLLAGAIGDDLIFYYDAAVWAYNLTSGGIAMVSDSTTSSATTQTEAITFGKSVFVANHDNQFEVERHNRAAYTTRTATLESGRFDFEYPGVSKALLSVTVVTDPLPAAVSVALAVSADGASFSSVSGTHDTDGATSFTWTVSSSGSAVVGKDFELRLTLATTNVANTPTVRSVTARAVGVDRKRVFQVVPDVVTRTAGSAGQMGRASDKIADLKALLTYNGVVKLSHGWDREDHDVDATYDCVLTQGKVVDAVGDADPAVLEFTEVSHV